MRNFVLLLTWAAAVCGVARAQTPECIDAWETLTKVREQLFAGGQSKRELAAMHHKIKAMTRNCEDLTELWQLRGSLAEMVGDASDVAVVKSRGSDHFASSALLSAAQAASVGFDPATPVGKRWALLAGTGSFQFKEKLGVTDLEFARRDVTRFGELLRTKFGFADVETLFGKQFTSKDLRRSIGKLRNQVAENDLVVIYLLSHGKPTKEDRNFTSFILASDTNPDDFYVTSIQVIDLVQEIYRELPSKRVVLILDTCFSGDAISGQKDYAGHPAPYLLDAFTRGSGRAVIAASKANQKSWELPDRRHGALMYCFDHVASPTATIGEIYSGLKSCVTSEVKALGVEQEPELFASEGARGIVLGKAP